MRSRESAARGPELEGQIAIGARAAMQDAGELRASLAGYREQLRAVEAHLESEGLEDAQRSARA